MLDEIRFWAQVIGDAHRTVLCSPENESRVKGWIDARDMGGMLTVEVSRYMPDDVIYLMDEQAIEALCRESIQRLTRP